MFIFFYTCLYLFGIVVHMIKRSILRPWLYEETEKTKKMIKIIKAIPPVDFFLYFIGFVIIIAIILWCIYRQRVKYYLLIKHPLYFMIFVRIKSHKIFVVIILIDLVIILSTLLGIIQAITGS